MPSSRIPPPDSVQAVGARLKLLRQAFSLAHGHVRELNKSEFPRLCGIGVQAWHNAESGYQRIGLDTAMRLRAATGAPLDFIYFGVRVGVPSALAEALVKIERRRSRRARHPP